MNIGLNIKLINKLYHLFIIYCVNNLQLNDIVLVFKLIDIFKN
jgi:hypothetical protein